MRRQAVSLLCECHRTYLHKPCNLSLTWPPYGFESFQASISKIERFHPYWRFALASNFPPKSAYLDFLKILNTVVYVVCHRPKRRYVAHDRTWNCKLLMKTLSQCVKWGTILRICGQSSRYLQLQSKHPATNYWVAEKIVGRKSGKILNNETWTNSFIEPLTII